MKQLENIHAVNISAKLWFDKVNGNTYHSVDLTIANKDATTIGLHHPMTYGYGNQWDQTSLDIFCKHYDIEIEKYPNGNKKHSYLSTFLSSEKIVTFVNVSQVKTRKELK